jgi:hypothetical protein
MPETSKWSWPKLFKVLSASGVAVILAFVVTFILVFSNHEWHDHLVRFLERAWKAFVAYNGSTSPGFVNSILLSFLGVLLFAIFIYFREGMKAMTDHAWENGLLAVLALIAGIFIVYGTQFAWEVAKVGYKDHESLATQASAKQLEESKRSNLQMSIEEFGVTDDATSSDGKPFTKLRGCSAWAIASVRNLGAPSIADEWKLTITVPGLAVPIQAALIDFNFRPGSKIDLAGDSVPIDKLLYRETISPIASGDKKQGFIAFFVAGHFREQLAQKGTTYILTAHDIEGHEVSTTAVFKGSPEAHRHYYGLE